MSAVTDSIPPSALAQHVAILGKTGSGKTSTAKLAIEQVVAQGARVCVLDPIKSDWWGLTSSADGKRPGLPFHILGGPRGHVPLHERAGKSIGEIVATGSLPLSIIDMADFAPGGQAQFFTDFAPALMRRMRGVVYLVIEESHLFAPKERSGIGAENMSIHWAKMLATSGRSKGIRLILLTQRVQALHNALLGSCDTLIAHRLTAPADQEPVLKWLKANVTEEIREKVAATLSSLKTGSGWICSGEAKLFELRHFPRIHTYDNTATPTNDSGEHAVKTAPVDQERLRAIIGDAVKEAEANDPKKLRARIAELEREAKKAPGPVIDEAAIKKAHGEGYDEAIRRYWNIAAGILPALDSLRAIEGSLREAKPVYDASAPKSIAAARPAPVVAAKAVPSRRTNGTGEPMSKAERAMLTVLAQYPQGRDRPQLGLLAGYSPTSGHIDNTVGAMRSKGWAGSGWPLKITRDGLAALGSWDPLPTGEGLRRYWLDRLDKAGAAFMRVLIDQYPEGVTREQLAEGAGYAPTSGHVDNTLGRLRTFELATRGWPVRASDVLFED